LKDQVVATIISLQVGQPRTVGSRESSDPFDEIWTTGFFKQSTSESLWLSTVNLAGDGQADLANHGGPEKAVNVYPVEHYPYWLETLPLPDLRPGAFGENFTTTGLLESDVCIGDVFEIGESLVQISQPRQPCWKLARRWGIKDLALRVQETGRTGWYFRVLREGHVQAGNRLLLVERRHPNWTVFSANEVMHCRTQDRQAAQDLADCAELSSRWRDKLDRRARTGTIESTSSRLDGPSGG
jgi:MOSC domain-containing protein YiiM